VSPAHVGLLALAAGAVAVVARNDAWLSHEANDEPSSFNQTLARAAQPLGNGGVVLPALAAFYGASILTGHIDDQEVIRELHCNCFVYVHGHSVGGTNPSLLKAMGYGNCVLALDTVFNREVLADGGVFFPRDEAVLAGEMQALEANPARVAELRQMGPERIRNNYTWEKIAGQYDTLFQEVAKR